MTLLSIVLILNIILILIIFPLYYFNIKALRAIQENSDHEGLINIQRQSISELREFLLQKVFKENQESSRQISNNLSQYLSTFSKEIHSTLTTSSKHNADNIEKLNNIIYSQLKDIRLSMDNSLSTNLAKTNETFSDITKRLALIDAAQKRMNELSTDIVSLQEILSNKQTRGAFGEVQLATIVKNILPAGHYEFQYTLKNGSRVDCIIKLPEPTGKLSIDSKFPLSGYQKMLDHEKNSADYQLHNRQFKKDIKKHISDIASKYIVHEETADCAIMFIPAESVFAEIHANHPDLVTESFEKRVWMVSPTTMMAILNTSNAVIKDIARQKEINLIQKHLNMLSKDFGRFMIRMNSLSKHIRQAHEDVDNVNASAKKIVNRFDQIEKVDIEPALEPSSEIKNNIA